MTRRGFSLIEVLAALCVLSLLAAALAPLVAQCRLLTATDGGDGAVLFDLARAADFLAKDAGALALDRLPVGAMCTQTLADGATIEVERRVFSSNAGPDANWLVFRSGSEEVVRFVPLVKDEGP